MKPDYKALLLKWIDVLNKAKVDKGQQLVLISCTDKDDLVSCLQDFVVDLTYLLKQKTYIPKTDDETWEQWCIRNMINVSPIPEQFKREKVKNQEQDNMDHVEVP